MEVQASYSQVKKGPSGLSGWLYFVLFELLMILWSEGLTSVGGIIVILNILFSTVDAQGIGTKIFIFTQCTMSFVFSVLSFFALICFFKKKVKLKKLCRWVFISYAVFVSWGILVSWWIDAEIYKSQYQDLIHSILNIAIWIPYIDISKRVENTFTY